MKFTAPHARRTLMTVFLCCLVALTGCDQQRADKSPPGRDSVAYLSAEELSERISSAHSPVLVEFSVPVGCSRCDEMRPQIDQLAKNCKDRAQICRVNLNNQRTLVAQMGVTVCPTYVAFDAGMEVFRKSYPTSGDVLAAELDGLLAAP